MAKNKIAIMEVVGLSLTEVIPVTVFSSLLGESDFTYPA